MNRTHADGAATILIGSILLIGGLATLQAYQQWIALSEMGGHMGAVGTAMHGTHPVWYVLGTVFVAGVIAGVYLTVRDRIISSTSQQNEACANGYEPSQKARNAVETQPAERRSKHESARQVLDILPDDERRILQPVLASPGLTQIELRDRSDFSKSKVSQTVTDLEKRGLLYREPQGRTYRIYPTESLTQTSNRTTSTE